MLYTEKRFKLKGISPILGSVSSDKEIYTSYIASKAKTEKESVAASEDADCLVENEDTKVSCFYRDQITNNPVLAAYQIKGFLKAAAQTLAYQLGINSTTSKIDNLIFIKERYIPYKRPDGSVITEPDGFLERPLRANTMQGPRVGLAKSEIINEWEVEFTLKLLDNKKTAKSEALSMELIEELLAYGELKGLLQWRNGGYGSFTFEEVK